MKDDVNEDYEKIVEIWSSIYKNVVRDLFTVEELKQEAWHALLKAERFIGDKAIDKSAFLAQSIKNRLLDIFLEELKYKLLHQFDGEAPTYNVDPTTPEETYDSLETYKKFRVSIKKIPHAEFVLSHMNTKTIREISEIAKREGKEMSKSQVYKIKSLIRKEFDKIIRR